MRRRRPKRRKLGLYLGAALLVALCFLFGAYHYMLHRFQQDIDKFLEALVTEEDMKEFHELKEQLRLEEILEVQKGLEDERREETESESPRERQVSKREPSPSNPNTPPPASPPADEGKGEEEGKDEKPPAPKPEDEAENPKEEEPQQKHAIFGSMPLKDQIYVISKINRFSVGELKQFIELYQTGGAAWDELKDRLLQRLTEEEIQALKALFLEYM